MQNIRTSILHAWGAIWSQGQLFHRLEQGKNCFAPLHDSYSNRPTYIESCVAYRTRHTISIKLYALYSTSAYRKNICDMNPSPCSWGGFVHKRLPFLISELAFCSQRNDCNEHSQTDNAHSSSDQSRAQRKHIASSHFLHGTEEEITPRLWWQMHWSYKHLHITFAWYDLHSWEICKRVLYAAALVGFITRGSAKIAGKSVKTNG